MVSGVPPASFLECPTRDDARRSLDCPTADDAWSARPDDSWISPLTRASVLQGYSGRKEEE